MRRMMCSPNLLFVALCIVLAWIFIYCSYSSTVLQVITTNTLLYCIIMNYLPGVTLNVHHIKNMWIKAIFTFMLPCIVTDFFFNNQSDAPIIQNLFCHRTLTCFGTLLCPSSGVLYCTFGIGKFRAGFWWPLPSRVRMELQGSSILMFHPAEQFHPDSAWKWSSKTCMKLTNAKCALENSWWWAQKLPKTFGSFMIE